MFGKILCSITTAAIRMAFRREQRGCGEQTAKQSTIYQSCILPSTTWVQKDFQFLLCEFEFKASYALVSSTNVEERLGALFDNLPRCSRRNHTDQARLIPNVECLIFLILVLLVWLSNGSGLRELPSKYWRCRRLFTDCFQSRLHLLHSSFRKPTSDSRRNA